MDRVANMLAITVLLFLGFYAVDYYFVPASLTVCIAEGEKVDTVIIKSGKEEIRQAPNSKREVRFKQVRKGFWQIFYEKEEERNEKAKIFVDGAGVWLSCPGDYPKPNI